MEFSQVLPMKPSMKQLWSKSNQWTIIKCAKSTEWPAPDCPVDNDGGDVEWVATIILKFVCVCVFNCNGNDEYLIIKQ